MRLLRSGCIIREKMLQGEVKEQDLSPLRTGADISNAGIHERMVAVGSSGLLYWGKHFIQAYNAQAAVDSFHQIIVAAETTNKPTDRGQAEPMMEKVKENTGRLPHQMSADTGYFSSEKVTALPRGVLMYISLRTRYAIQILCWPHLGVEYRRSF